VNDFIKFSSVLVGYRSVGHVNARIVIRINISVDLLQLKEFMEVGNVSIYFLIAKAAGVCDVIMGL